MTDQEVNRLHVTYRDSNGSVTFVEEEWLDLENCMATITDLHADKNLTILSVSIQHRVRWS